MRKCSALMLRCKCSNAQMHKCSNVQMHICSNAQMHKGSDAQILRCTNTQMHKCSDAQMLKCSNAQMHKCSDAQMLKCSNAQILKFSTKRTIPTYLYSTKASKIVLRSDLHRWSLWRNLSSSNVRIMSRSISWKLANLPICTPSAV